MLLTNHQHISIFKKKDGEGLKTKIVNKTNIKDYNDLNQKRMNKINTYTAFFSVFFLYLIQFQLVLSEQIRQELRKELGFINIYLFPILVIINIVYFIKVLLSNTINKKIKYCYIVLTVIFYTIFLTVVCSS